jgi:hypothetical protein
METESSWGIPCWSSDIAEILDRDFAIVMNSSPTSPTRQTPNQTGRWLLEIVRGRDVGRAFALEPGETVVGNASNGQTGLDLREQEANSPRRMAARQATLECIGHDLSIRDLDSPGGTFVNQQRLLSGQPRKLASGDVIQLGGVQLKVKQGLARVSDPGVQPTSSARVSEAAVRVTEGLTSRAPGVSAPPPAPPAQGGRLSTPFAMASGAQCRTWDDFLVLSAQSWSQVRDELSSGRLTEYLRRIGRPELIPHSAPDRSPDDRLDEWLARLPATQSTAPELDVHPGALLVQAKMGGGVTRLSLRITNVGYRLLRSTLWIEPADTQWVKLLAGQERRPFQTIDQTEIPIVIELPETIDRVLRALIVIESNGGTRRVEVRIERPAEAALGPEPVAGQAVSELPILATKLRTRLAPVSPFVRAVAIGGGAAALRLLFALMSAVPLGGAASSLAEPRIASVALIMVVLGVVSGLILAKRRGETNDLLTAGSAGGLLGLLSSALWFSMLQSAERVLGSWSTSIAAVCLLWGAAGALLAVLSVIFIPHVQPYREESP